MPKNSNKVFLISDDEIEKEDNIIWTNTANKINNVSIPQYIEKNAEKLKKDYINIIDNLENIPVNNKKLYDFSSLNKHFSFLWISDVYEKSIYKNKNIINQLKLIALKDLFKVIKPELIHINLKNIEDEKSIVKLCEYLKIDTTIKKKNIFKIKVKEFILVKIFFAFIKFIRFVYLRLTFEKVDFELLKKKKNLFFTYSIYSNFEDIKKGIFNSVYWDALIKKKFLDNDCAWCNIFFTKKKN